jgi:hypothetical protein
MMGWPSSLQPDIFRPPATDRISLQPDDDNAPRKLAQCECNLRVFIKKAARVFWLQSLDTLGNVEKLGAAEDDWERIRNGISPKPGDAHRIYSEVLASFWQPQPSHTLFDTKTFKAGLDIHGREIVVGDMMFHIHLAEGGASFKALASELRPLAARQPGRPSPGRWCSPAHNPELPLSSSHFRN